uniref:Uncharacterized protein n=1 Tax=Palpitomonas bilix TaxID=652834 RepID=A0A7S3D0Q7_9EUKA
MQDEISIEAFGIRLEERRGRGRCVIANKPFRAGEVVLRNSAFSYILQSKVAAERCHHCFQRKGKPMSCNGCKRARYCSRDCQKADWALHKYECCAESALGYNDMGLPVDDDVRLLFRTAVAYSLEQQAEVESGEVEGSNGGKEEGVESVRGSVRGSMRGGDGGEGEREKYELLDGKISLRPSYHDVDEMDDHLDDFELHVDKVQQANVVVGRCLRALSLAKHKFKSLRVPDGRTLRRWLSLSDCNNFSIWDDLILPIASACFPFGALLNHSCAPNCVLHYDVERKIQIIRCVRDVEKGEELCHSYIDVAGTTQQRREKLSRQFFFLCMCPLCQEKGDRDPLLTSTSAQDEAARAELQTSAALLHQAEAMDDGSPAIQRETIKVLSDAYRTRRRYCQPGNLLLLESQSRLHTALLEAGELEADAKVLKEIIDAYRLIYPSYHPLIGLNLYTLGTILPEIGEKEEAERVLDEAIAILSVTHGRSTQFVQKLKECRSSLASEEGKWR